MTAPARWLAVRGDTLFTEMMATAMHGAVDCHTPPCESVDDVRTALREHACLRDAAGPCTSRCRTRRRRHERGH